MTGTSSPTGFRNTSQAESAEQGWKSLTTYGAETTIKENIYRAGNIAAFNMALYGAYSFLTGPMGIVSYVAIALAVRKIASTAIGYCVYPAALASFKGYIKQVGQWQIKASVKRIGYSICAYFRCRIW